LVDIITRFAEQNVNDTSELNRAVARSVNEIKSLSFKRDGKETNVSVSIPETSDPTIIFGQLPRPIITSLRDVGLELGGNGSGQVICRLGFQ
jgi:hypothetical protein